MENTKPYFIQYCELIQEWNRKGITYDTVTESQKALLSELLEKAEKYDRLCETSRTIIGGIKLKMNIDPSGN